MNKRSSQDALDRGLRRPLAIVRRTPRTVLLVLVALALGLGVNTAIYFRVYFDFLTPYPHSDELVLLRPEMLGPAQGVRSEDFLRWKAQTTAFQELSASTERVLKIRTRDGSIKVVASLVTPGFYRMMGDRFSLGYDFAPEEDRPGRKRQVILTNSMWKQLGADPNVIGSTLFVDLDSYRVVGVLAPGQRDQGGSIAIPLVLSPGLANQNDLHVNVIGRLAPGVSIREARAELNKIVAQTPYSRIDSNHVWGVSIEPFRRAALANDRKLLIWLFLGGAAFLVLLEWASVANLLRLRSDAAYQHR
jgi:putative ABC transport system permease protein